MQRKTFLPILVCATTSWLACVDVFPPSDDPDAGRQRLEQARIDSGELSVPEVMYLGRNLAIRNWKLEDGFGNGDGRPAPNINRLPGPDSTSCMSCHGLGNGVILGWGNNAGNVLVSLDDPVNPTIAGSNERNTPTVHGLALLELLAKEISLELQAIRDEAVVEAQATGSDATRVLVSKGVDYGSITAHPDGTVDTSGVQGIDADLRLRPFHAKGHEATIRIFTRGALNRHHGIQSTEFLLMKDATRRPDTWDADEDGVVNELTEGELTAMTLFQVCMPIPQEVDQEDEAIARGRQLMQSIGCTECHVPFLKLNDPTWRYTSSSGKTLSVDLTETQTLGAGRPIRETDGSVLVRLWGDLKRHDLGPESHEPLDQPVDLSKPNYEGGAYAQRIDETLPPIPKELMMTTELWGGRDTGPWWHDGSSPTIEDAVLRHGGEGQASRDAFVVLTAEERATLLAFLDSLQVAPVGEILVTADPEANSSARVTPSE
ncbi:MAG: hypothetical protein C4547_00920 [Phycisphaerales bacterium]|nr:MAG: hypothetical protein C4547_00920 [Phycisphaerales bacterium]